MEKTIIEFIGIVFKMLIRYWAKDKGVLGQNIIDIEQFAAKCGLSVWDAKKFSRTIDEFIDSVAEDFIREFGAEIQEKERKNSIIAQIQEDVKKIGLNEKKVLIELSTPESLRNAIMEQSKKERELWTEQETGLYANCVRYLSKAGLDFVSKLPTFTPEALKVVVERQTEYHKELVDILKDIHSMTALIKSLDVTYREYEGLYREKLIEKYSKIELIGSGINDRAVRRYDISLAYVELSCIDDNINKEIKLSKVFGTNKVVWIRGEAGSGKTTFLQWVAVCAAKNEYDRIDNVRNTVPIVIGLRSVSWPLNLTQIVNKVTQPFGNNCPDGWIGKLLKNNRAILLFDGLDEISPARREETYDFLEQIISRHPHIRVLLTARNSVHDDLDCGYANYEIMPMKTKNIKRFVSYWHRSVLRRDAVENDKTITALQRNLVIKIVENQSLKTLARNPLLCAMICALNYVNGQQLPNDKIELYDKCCEMLMDGRDSQRQIDSSIYQNLSKLDYSRRRKVLEELAFWMMNCGVSSETWKNVLGFFEHLFRDTSIFDKDTKCNAEMLLNYFVDRSGIIREPEKGIIDYVHKTFMEFLAVKSICRNCAWKLIVKEACNANWKETILMCFREMGRENVEDILKELIEKGAVQGDNRYILIASLGATNAMFLSDKEIKEQIDSYIKTLIPPQDKTIYEIAQAGSYLLPFLNDTKEYSDRERRQCLTLLDYLETEEAIPQIMSYLWGFGDEEVKGRALEILCKYEEQAIEEYSVREQLIDILKISTEGHTLFLHTNFLNLLGEKKLEQADAKFIMRINTLTLLCSEDEESLYEDSTDFLRYLPNCHEVTLRGYIKSFDFLNKFNRITDLTICADGDLSEPMCQLSSLHNLDHVKHLYIYAEKLNFFCNSDLERMERIETIEIHCLYDSLDVDLDFDRLACFPTLRQIILEVNKDLEEEISGRMFKRSLHSNPIILFQ